MNLRPSGYEPDELPDCSTPHQEGRAFYKRSPLPATRLEKLSNQRVRRESDATESNATAGSHDPRRRAAVGNPAQAIAAVISFASAAPTCGFRVLMGHAIPSPSRAFGLGMI